MAQDGGRWQALLNTAMNLGVLAPRTYLLDGSCRGLISRTVSAFSWKE
jgi:hypothetical protein